VHIGCCSRQRYAAMLCEVEVVDHDWTLVLKPVGAGREDKDVDATYASPAFSIEGIGRETSPRLSRYRSTGTGSAALLHLQPWPLETDIRPQNDAPNFPCRNC
jgi:hypothetical protein